MSDTFIREMIKENAQRETDSGGQKYHALTVEDTIALAERLSLTRREVELIALEENIVPRRYQRSLGTVGLQGQIRLLKARVGVVGTGGLGGLALELLARMGVGSLVAVDGDTFTDSNLNRQLLCSEDNLNHGKAEKAAERVRQVNGAIRVEAHRCMAGAGNLPRLVEGCSVILDCLDNLPSRFDLEKVCQEMEIPLVHGAIAGFLGQVAVIWPGEPLLSVIYGNSGKSSRGVETVLGNPAATPAMLASWQVSEAVKIIVGLEGILRGQLLIMDMLSAEVTRVRLEAGSSLKKG